MGDVGVWDRGIFRRLTSLEQLGIYTRVRKGLTPANFSFTSEASVDVRNDLSGKIVPGQTVVKAQIELTFSNRGGFIFQAIDCYQDDIDDKAGLAKVVLGTC